MLETYTCPNCNKEVNSSTTICEHCGVSLAIAAVLAENAVAKKIAEPSNIEISPEILVPRVGDYLVERGMLSPNELQEALEYQKAQSEAGNYILLGQILVEKKYITQRVLDTAITEQIVILQDALKKSNSELEQRVEERTDELQQALHKITELNQLKTNFISNISHELRTPLTHMVGYLELLRDQSLGPTNEDQSHAVNVLLKSYNRLHNLIDDLIQFSMLSQGEMSIAQEPITTTTIIENATAHASNIANEKEINLTITNTHPNTYVFADKDKISWVLGELIENGIKFNNAGGKVIVKSKEENGVVFFQVIDSGIGIEPKQLEEIFVPFHQLDGSSTRKYGGTGIGLALAKQIIEAHGSQLKADSIVNKGSSFEFKLPKVEATNG
jgi:signal transduction histidine kinase